jgi:hypothetical protein
MSEVTSLAPRPWMRPPKGSWVGLLSPGRGNRYYRYQRRGRQFKIAQMLAAKVLDEHEWIIRKLDHRRAWYASSSRSASAAWIRCRRSMWRNTDARRALLAIALDKDCLVERRAARCPQDAGPATIWPVACQSRRSAGPLRRGYAQRADPDAAAPDAYGTRSRGSRPSRPAAAAPLPARSLFPSSTGRGRAQVAPFSFRPRVEGTLRPPRVRLSLFILLCAPGAGRGFRRLSRRRSGQAPAKG